MAVAERGITHGLRYQARALAQVPAARDNSAWLAGTTALREENEVSARTIIPLIAKRSDSQEVILTV